MSRSQGRPVTPIRRRRPAGPGCGMAHRTAAGRRGHRRGQRTADTRTDTRTTIRSWPIHPSSTKPSTATGVDEHVGAEAADVPHRARARSADIVARLAVVSTCTGAESRKLPSRAGQANSSPSSSIGSSRSSNSIDSSPDPPPDRRSSTSRPSHADSTRRPRRDRPTATSRPSGSVITTPPGRRSRRSPPCGPGPRTAPEPPWRSAVPAGPRRPARRPDRRRHRRPPSSSDVDLLALHRLHRDSATARSPGPQPDASRPCLPE